METPADLRATAGPASESVLTSDDLEPDAVAPDPALEAAETAAQGDDAAGAEPLAPRQAASEQAIATRRAFSELKALFGEGGSRGWKNVGGNLARLQELLLDSPDGFEAFLVSLDEEKDASFLEALLHHLPLAKTENADRAREHAELQAEIWGRYEDETEPDRRLAFLRFFAFDRRLSASRMGEFLELARAEEAPRVRQLAIDAIASNRELIPDTWPVLAQALEHDASAECRQTAINGLAYAEAEGARALVRAAFTSPDEGLRAAALSSVAGDAIPPEVTGGDATTYLVAELRGARTRKYRQAVVERLMLRAPDVLEVEIQAALAAEKDWAAQRDYREALQRIAASRSRREGE